MGVASRAKQADSADPVPVRARSCAVAWDALRASSRPADTEAGGPERRAAPPFAADAAVTGFANAIAFIYGSTLEIDDTGTVTVIFAALQSIADVTHIAQASTKLRASA